MRRGDDDVDGDHSKLVVCDGHAADLIRSYFPGLCTHPVLQSCSAAWLERLMIDLDDTGLVLDNTHTHPVHFNNNNNMNHNNGLDSHRCPGAD